MDVENIIKRLISVTNTKNKRGLAKHLNTTPQNINSWKLRKKKPYSVCELISKQYNVSIGWLLEGESAGTPIKQEVIDLAKKLQVRVKPVERAVDRVVDRSVDHAVEHNLITKANTLDKADISRICIVPFYEVMFSAGTGQLVDYEENLSDISFSTRFLKHLNASNALVLSRVVGDSMEPKFRDGDIIMLDMNNTTLSRNSVYGFRIEDELYIKKYTKNEQDNIVLLSINADYDPIVISAANQPADFKVIGKVIWHSRKIP